MEKQASPTLFDLDGAASATIEAPKVVKKPKAAKEKDAQPSKPTAAAKSEAKESGTARRASAEELATKQREISVSEFFTKNRHLLGFDSPLKAAGMRP